MKSSCPDLIAMAVTSIARSKTTGSPFTQNAIYREYDKGEEIFLTLSLTHTPNTQIYNVTINKIKPNIVSKLDRH